MYQPLYFQENNKERALDFIRKNPFACLISQNPFNACHVPIIAEESGTKLYTHVAAKNPMADLNEGAKTLAIFHGPHAYISPKHYKSLQSVPTWNYIAVHVKARIIELDRDRSEEILMHLVDQIEPDYKEQWQEISSQYKSALINEMRPLGMEIISVQMTTKISQNKSKAERKRIADYLLSTDNSNAREIGAEMQKIL